MKKLVLFLSCVFLSVVSFAQISPFHYQGVLREETGDLLSNTSIDLRLSILEGGATIFQEEIRTQTDDYGQFLTQVGSSSPLPELDFQNNSYFLQIEIDQGGGFVQAGGSSILPTPYASRAIFAEEVGNVLLDDIEGIDINGIQINQVLKWDGTRFIPGDDISEGSSLSAGEGIRIENNRIINEGDLNADDDITTSTDAEGDLDGSYPAPIVTGMQGNPLSDQAPEDGEVLKWNGQEWVPSDDNTSSSSGGVNSSPRLSGDGTSSDPLDIAQQGASQDQVLKWNGQSWTPADDAGQLLIAGNGIDINGNTIENTGDLDPANDIEIGDDAGGDLGGAYPNLLFRH